MERNNILVGISIISIMIISIIIALFTVPISNDTQDIKIDIKIHQPLVGEVEIKEASATSSPHTILNYGSISDVVNFVEDVSDGDDYTISATSGNVNVKKQMDAITRTTEIETSLKLINVDKSEKVVIVKLLDGDNTVDIKEVTIQ